MKRIPARPKSIARTFQAFAFGTFVALTATGCVKNGDARNVSELPLRPGMTREDVEDLAFADDMRALMVAPPASPARKTLLERVARTQFRRCERRFQQHFYERGLLCVEGTLYLFRVGEMTSATLATARSALQFAASEFSRRGDAGRARASYDLLRESSAKPEQKSDVDAHIKAIESWVTVAPENSLRRAGAEQQEAKARWLLEPTQAAFDGAKNKTNAWVKRAIDLMATLRVPNAPSPPREDLAEAYRALDSGSRALVLHYLREADAKGASLALESPIYRDHTSRSLRGVIGEASRDPSAENWLALLRQLTAAPKEGEETEIDRRDLGAAAFSVAWEAFRLDPTNPESAGTLASVLSSFGLNEAIPSIIADAAKEHAGPKALSSALVLVMRAMQDELEASDLGGVRRTFLAAEPLLALAEGSKQLPEVSPSPFRVRALMGEVELRDGNLERANELLSATQLREPTAGGHYALARIARHRGDLPRALTALDAATRSLRAEERVLNAEIALLRAEIVAPRDEALARKTLLDAAIELQGAKRGAPKGLLASLERTEARVLDHLGEDELATSAIERALDAASRDRHEAADAFSFLVGRALIQGKVEEGRETLRRAMGWGLEDDDLVYLALWVRHLERMKKLDADPVVTRVLALQLDARWVSALAAFGSGRIDAAELHKRAKTPIEHAEATFYGALDMRARGQAFQPELQRVLTGTAPDLVEVGMARDLLEPNRRLKKGPTPGLAKE